MKIKPWLALLLLAPAFGEVTCGSTPPAKFGDVPGLILNAILYGGGALLIREVVVRCRKGWPALLLLGAAYGVVEEGIMCKSFFDPNFPGIDRLGIYGRAVGVNWVWAYFLTAYHALYSIGFSVLVTEALYPNAAKQRWLKGSGIGLLASLFAADVAFGYALFPTAEHPYRLGLERTLGAFGVVAAFCALAWFLPAVRPQNRPPKRPVAFAVTGFLCPLPFFIVMYASSRSVLHPALYLAFATAGLAAYSGWLFRLSGGGGDWGPSRRVAFMAGVIAGMIPVAVLADALRGFSSGMLLVAVAEAALIVVLLRRLRNPQPANGPPPLAA